MPNAEHTFVGQNATIRADATSSGNGGKVIVWSDAYTQFYGQASARGGAQGGNGGLIEVSSHNYLDFQGSAMTLAPQGRAGTLLLDPSNLTIDNTSDQAVTASTPFTPSGSPPPALNSHLTWATLTGAGGLGGGDVIVTTVGSPNSSGQQGDITVAAASPDLATGNQLKLQAAGAIKINAAIQNTGSGTLVLESQGIGANGGIALAAPITLAGNLNLNVTGAGAAVSGSSLVTANTLTLSGVGAVGVDALNPLNTVVSALIDNKSGGNAFIREVDGLTLTGTLTGGSALDLAEVPGGITTIGAGNLNAGGGNVTLGGDVAGAGTITAGTLTLNGAGTVGVDALTRLNTAVGTLVDNKSGGDVFVNQTGALNVHGTTTTAAGALDVLANIGITIDAALNLHGGAALGDTLTLSGTTVAFNNPVTARTVTLNNSGAATGSGTITAGTLNLNGNGNVGSSGSRLNTTVGALTLNKGGGNVFLSEADGLTVLSGTLTGGSSLDLSEVSGSTTILGSLNANSGNVTLSGAVDGAGLITANKLTLSGTGDVGASGAELNTTVATLDFLKTGTSSSFVKETDGLTLTRSAGSGSPNLTLLELVNATVLGGGDFNIGGGTLTLDGAADSGGFRLIADNLNLTGSGNVDNGGSPSFNIQVNQLTLAKTGGNTLIRNYNDTALSGTTGGGSLNLVQNSGGITLAATLDAGGGDVLLQTSTLSMGANNINGNNVTLENSGALTDISGKVTAAGTLTLRGTGQVGTDPNPLNTAVAALDFIKGTSTSFVREDDGLTLTRSAGSGNPDLTLRELANATVLGGNFNISGGTLTLGGAVQGHPSSGSFTITADTLILTGNGDVRGFAASERLNTTISTLTLNKTGGDTLVNETGALDLSGTAAGKVDIQTGTGITLTGALDAGVGDLLLKGTTMTLGNNNLSGANVTLDNSDDLTDSSGKVTSSGTLTLLGTGNVGGSAAGTELKTAVGTLDFSKGGGTSYVKEDDGLTLLRSTASGNPDLTLREVANATVMGGNFNLGSGDLTVAGAINGGGLITAGTLTLNGGGDVGVNGGNRLNTSVSSIVFNKAGGDSFIQEANAVSVEGTTGTGGTYGNVDLTAGGNVALAGNLSVGSSLAVGANLDLQANRSITTHGTPGSVFVSGKIQGANGKKLTFIWDTPSSSFVQCAEVDVVSLVLNGAQLITDVINGEVSFGSDWVFNQNLTLGGTLLNPGHGFTFNGTLTLSADSGISTADGVGGGAPVIFNNTVSGPWNLTLDLGNPASAATFNQPVTIGSMTVNNGSLLGSGLLTMNTLTLNGGGDVGTVGTPLNTSVGALVFGKSGGNSYINEADRCDAPRNSREATCS